mgnify:CR=1 FL=1
MKVNDNQSIISLENDLMLLKDKDDIIFNKGSVILCMIDDEKISNVMITNEKDSLEVEDNENN